MQSEIQKRGLFIGDCFYTIVVQVSCYSCGTTCACTLLARLFGIIYTNMKILGINGGNGVILYPFRKHLVANIEPRGVFRTPENKQWRSNFPDIPLYKDLAKLNFEPNELDLIIGAPDCGHSSILGVSRNKVYGDPRANESLNMYIAGVKKFLPKVWAMENLSKLLETIPKTEWRENFPEYKILFHDNSVFDYGNSQKNRVRLVIIGIKKGIGISTEHFRSVFQVNDPKLCGELAEGLIYGENAHVREDIDSVLTLYAGYKTSAKVIRDKWLETNWTRWQVEGRNFSTAPGVYRNLDTQYPNTARKANRQYNQAGLMMTPRELARIMGVPDAFEIVIEKDKLGYWINKGRLTVTKGPPMEVSKWLKKCLIFALNGVN